MSPKVKDNITYLNRDEEKKQINKKKIGILIGVGLFILLIVTLFIISDVLSLISTSFNIISLFLYLS